MGMPVDVWTTREGVSRLTDDIIGWTVAGRDEMIGKLDHVSFEGTCVIVTTGRIRGKKYVVPAWTIERLDPENETVTVDVTKDQVENSPEYDEALGFDEACESKVGSYYEDLASTR
jgi:hypothetical protein